MTMQKSLFAASLLFFIASTSVSALGLTEEKNSSIDSPHVALVIGNAAYEEHSLLTPLNDARAIGRRLTDAGIDVIHLENSTSPEIEQALKEMNRRLLGTKGAGLFYFAGHGAQVSDSKLIMPIDADTTTSESLIESTLKINDIAKLMSFQRIGQPNIIIVDACLTNPFTSISTSSVAPPAQTLLAYATSPGGTAYDGDAIHGIFTQALLNELNDKRLSFTDILNRARFAVTQSTQNLQSPWITSSLKNRLVLMPASTSRTAVDSIKLPSFDNTQLLAMRTRGNSPNDSDAKYELEFWLSIKDSRDPSDYKAYLEAYPNGKFTPLAKARAKRYKQAPAIAITKPKPAPVKPKPVVRMNPAPTKSGFSIATMDDEYTVIRKANIRQKPYSYSTQIAKLRQGSSVHVIGQVIANNQIWYQVRSSGITGFVYGDLLQEQTRTTANSAPPPVTWVETPNLNITSSKDCSTCPEMLTLPAGNFIMGTNHSHPSEKPAHRVSISQPFAIGKYEVTLDQWYECVDEGVCASKPALKHLDGNQPVHDLSWSDTQKYVNWLSNKTGQDYRLPTEAEWEYAAKAGSESKFWWGNTAGRGNANCKKCGGEWDKQSPAAVNAFPANSFGLHGTSGGVSEWVLDCWHKSYKGAPRNSRAWGKQDCRENVIRGGGWRNDSTYIHSTSRLKYDSDVQYILHGFRVAKTIN